jgi:hypothetical protein
MTAYNGKQPGDPQRAAEIIIDLVKGEGVGKGKTVPTVFTLGSDAYEFVKAATEKTLSRLEEWKDVTSSTDFPKGT